MEMLSYLAQAGKRKKKFLEQATDLANEYPSVQTLEAEMAKRNKALVDRLKYAKIRFSEFQRVGADSTITSALAGVMIGDGTKTALTDATFASTLGSLPYLWKFYREIEQSLKDGRIEYQTEDFADSPTKYANRQIDYDDDMIQDAIDMMPTTLIDSKKTGSTPATWEGVNERMSRYLVTPIYGWWATGEEEMHRRTGYRQMRRIARMDKATCKDCAFYESEGWQPMGTLPMPGHRCQCLDRCRCIVEYR